MLGRCALMGLWLLVPANVGADTYRNAEHHFSIELPAGWEVMPDELFDQLRHIVRSQGIGDHGQLVAGIHRAGAKEGVSPFIIVSVTSDSANGATIEQIEKEMMKGFESGMEKVKASQPKLQINNPTPLVFDKNRGRAVWRMSLQLGDKGQMETTTYMHFGVRGTVYVQAFVMQKEQDQYEPIIARIDDSFRFDPAYQIKLKSQSDGRDNVYYALARWRGDVCVTLTVGAVVIVGIFWQRRRGARYRRGAGP